MSDSKDAASVRSRDIDISKPGRPQTKGGWLWLLILLLLSVFLYLTKGQVDGMPLVIEGWRNGERKAGFESAVSERALIMR
jgi:hypothetical protein